MSNSLEGNVKQRKVFMSGFEFFTSLAVVACVPVMHVLIDKLARAIMRKR